MEPLSVTKTSNTRRRGHQHHPRHTTRRRLDQIQASQSLTNNNDSSFSTSSSPDGGPAQCGPIGVPIANSSNLQNDRAKSSPKKKVNTFNLNLLSPTQTIGAPKVKKTPLDAFIDNERPAQCGQDDNDNDDESLEQWKYVYNFEDQDIQSPELEHAVARAQGDGISDEESGINEEDPEMAELIRLRCPSERTEIQSEREARRRKRCADYPGLAFGFSIFSSDTMMKFNLIRNELKNLTSNQLKRVSMMVNVLMFSIT